MNHGNASGDASSLESFTTRYPLNTPGYSQNTTGAIEGFSSTGLANSTVATQQPPSANGDGPEEKSSSGWLLLKKGNAYYLHIDLWNVWADKDLLSLMKWFGSLTGKDTVYFHQAGSPTYYSWIAQLIGALMTCKANTIFVLDRLMETGAWALACKTIKFVDTGAICFNRGINTDSGQCETAFLPVINALYANATKRGWLTQDEVDDIFKNDSILYMSSADIQQKIAGKGSSDASGSDTQ